LLALTGSRGRAGISGVPELYDRIGIDYTSHRRADPRIAEAILREVGDATTVVNVGAGAGAYEPSDRRVLAVEPSGSRRRDD
jgi:hypothetical protein